MLERNQKSIVSFFKYYNLHNYTFTCVFGGYAGSDELWNEIENTINSESKNKNTIVVRYDINYGKAHIVNDLASKFLEDNDYFLTADSDILFKSDEPNTIERLVEGFEEATNLGLNPSLIALFHEEGNCHMLDLCYEHKYYYHGKYGYEMICHPNGGGGVAGGCIFISSKFWNEIGGYKVLGVYAGDDANIMYDSYKKGYKFLLSNSIRCIHPHEDNEKYANWKVSVCPKVQNLPNAVSEADVFWKTES
jgi:hypothetical protein